MLKQVEFIAALMRSLECLPSHKQGVVDLIILPFLFPRCRECAQFISFRQEMEKQSTCPDCLISICSNVDSPGITCDAKGSKSYFHFMGDDPYLKSSIWHCERHVQPWQVFTNQKDAREQRHVLTQGPICTAELRNLAARLGKWCDCETRLRRAGVQNRAILDRSLVVRFWSDFYVSMKVMEENMSKRRKLR